MKKIISILTLFVSIITFSQVGIGTKNPQGIFNVDGAKDNAETGTPTAAQQLNDFTVLANGNVGIGTVAPTQKLDVNGQLRIRGGNPAAGSVLTSDADGVASWQAPSAVATPTFRYVTGGDATIVPADYGNVVIINVPTNNNIIFPTPTPAIAGRKVTIISIGAGASLVTNLNGGIYRTNTYNTMQQHGAEFINDGTFWYSLGGQ
jgi:hypothetical protein